MYVSGGPRRSMLPRSKLPGSPPPQGLLHPLLQDELRDWIRGRAERVDPPLKRREVVTADRGPECSHLRVDPLPLLGREPVAGLGQRLLGVPQVALGLVPQLDQSAGGEVLLGVFDTLVHQLLDLVTGQ